MKILAASLLAAVVGASHPASSPQPSAPEDEGMTVLLSTEDVAKCEAEGGCHIFTRQFIESIQRRAFEAGQKACRTGRET